MNACTAARELSPISNFVITHHICWIIRLSNRAMNFTARNFVLAKIVSQRGLYDWRNFKEITNFWRLPVITSVPETIMRKWCLLEPSWTNFAKVLRMSELDHVTCADVRLTFQTVCGYFFCFQLSACQFVTAILYSCLKLISYSLPLSSPCLH